MPSKTFQRSGLNEICWCKKTTIVPYGVDNVCAQCPNMNTILGYTPDAKVEFPDEGKKYDQGKLPEHLLSIPAHNRLLEVLAAGAKKYGERNWERGMEWSRVYAATLRHLHAWWSGESLDPETGMSHLAHAMANIHFLNHYEEKDVGTDDRPNDKDFGSAA